MNKSQILGIIAAIGCTIVSPAARAESIDRQIEAYNRFPAGDNSAAKAKLFNQIQSAISNVENKQTISLLQNLARKYPNNLFVRETLAHALFQRERLAESISEYRQAIAIDPTRTANYDSLRIAIERKADNESIAIFRQLAQAKPNAASYLALSKSLKERDRDEAVKMLDRAISLEPKNIALYVEKVDYVRSSGEEVLALYRQASTAIPNQPNVAIDLSGALFKSLNHMTEAQRMLALANQQFPRNTEIAMRLMTAKALVFKFDEAIAFGEAHVAKADKPAIMHAVLAALLMQQHDNKNLDRAIYHYKQSAVKNESSELCSTTIGDTLLAKNRGEDAFQIYLAADKTCSPLAYQFLARKLKQPDRAIGLLRKKIDAELAAPTKTAASNNNTDLGFDIFLLTTLMFERNRLDDAIGLMQSIANNPTIEKSYRLLGLGTLGRIYRTQGKWEAAVQIYDRILAENSHRNLPIMVRLPRASALVALGRYEQAIADYRAVLARSAIDYRDIYGYDTSNDETVPAFKSHAVAHNGLGEVYLKQGKTDLAIAAFKAAIGADPQLPAAKANLAKFRL